MKNSFGEPGLGAPTQTHLTKWSRTVSRVWPGRHGESLRIKVNWGWIVGVAVALGFFTYMITQSVRLFMSVP
jgi:hypothetical protein